MNSIPLRKRHCTPCKDGGEPLSHKEATELLASVPAWQLGPDAKTIEREFSFPDFIHAFHFVGKITNIAEEEGHHPDIELSWGRAKVTLWTHKVGGLTENDFILAAKIDAL